MIWLLIGYMWLFIHRPFEIWPVLATIHLERMYMIATILCWLVSGPRLPSKNRLHWSLGFFFLAILASWLSSPYSAAGWPSVNNYLKYTVFYVLLVTSVHDVKSLRMILVGHIGVMTLVMAHSLREYFNGAVWYHQGILRIKGPGATFANYNDFASLVVIGLPMAWVVWHEWNDRWKRLMLLGYVGMSGYCVVLTGSRMGACGFALAALMVCVASPKRWRLLTLASILFVALWGILPEDRATRYLTLVDNNVGPEQARRSLGNMRLGGFERGLELFYEQPLFGYGPMSYGVVTGTGMMPHNLYGQLLAELGLVGAIAFGCMALGVFRNRYEARRMVYGKVSPDTQLLWRTINAMTATFVLLLFMGWGFNYLLWHVWLWYGGIQAVAIACLAWQPEPAHEATEFVDGVLA